MKKKTKKLELAKETVRALATNDYALVDGGRSEACNTSFVIYGCAEICVSVGDSN